MSDENDPHDDAPHGDHDHGGTGGSELSAMDLRVRALESLLVEKGYVDPQALDAMIDPRGVLKDFGCELPAATEIRVRDSTAEIRYLVVPMRPSGAETWHEDDLARLVTRDSMIGTGLARQPAPGERP